MDPSGAHSRFPSVAPPALFRALAAVGHKGWCKAETRQIVAEHLAAEAQAARQGEVGHEVISGHEVLFSTTCYISRARDHRQPALCAVISHKRARGDGNPAPAR
eukprot:1157186-Pelagomonas_calceolata.AAC.11